MRNSQNDSGWEVEGNNFLHFPNFLFFSFLWSCCTTCSIFLDLPCFPVLHFIVLHRFCIFLQIECCGDPALSKAVGIFFSSSICSLRVSVLHFDNSCHISSVFIIICYCDQRPLRLLLLKDYNLLKSQVF